MQRDIIAQPVPLRCTDVLCRSAFSSPGETVEMRRSSAGARRGSGRGLVVPQTDSYTEYNLRQQNECLLSLTANTQQLAEPEFDCGDSNTAPNTSGHPDSNGGDCNDGQPNQGMSGAVHAPNNSTVAENTNPPHGRLSFPCCARRRFVPLPPPAAEAASAR